MSPREYAIYRPGFPTNCFGEFLGIVVAADRHEAARLGRYQFGGDVIAFWHRPQVQRPKRTQAVYRRMTADEQRMIEALARATFLPASWAKRFARDLAAQATAHEPKITDRQAEALAHLVHTYRRQLPADVRGLLETTTGGTP